MKAATRKVNVSNYLLQMIVNNAAICLGLALLALIVGRTFKRPAITHLIWLLVLMKLLTPPVIKIPAFAVPGMVATNPPAAFEPIVGATQQDMGTAQQDLGVTPQDIGTAPKDKGTSFQPGSLEIGRDFREENLRGAIQWKQLLFLA